MKYLVILALCLLKLPVFSQPLERGQLRMLDRNDFAIILAEKVR